ncbi:hypothetical protein OG728_39250 (plasmid) [Streptomyces microflavus]|uniref:hypothetical protein n=1 Tax=Streptomyces microflavus TaxID=1919 RepID=UPI002E124BF7|nr:hypothetical protein OG728_39250 [Streptomyces microflavus]
MSELRDNDPAARNAAGTQLLHETFIRWRDMPTARLTLARRDAWMVLLALQSAVTHPGFAGSSWALALVDVGHRLQDATADDPEVYAAAERGWAAHDTGAPSGDPETDAAGMRLMLDAYTRWQSMPPVSVSVERRDMWTVMMGLQVAVAHPSFSPDTLMGRIVESVGRQLQEGLCDNAELYAVAAAGWDRAADVAQDGDR